MTYSFILTKLLHMKFKLWKELLKEHDKFNYKGK